MILPFIQKGGVRIGDMFWLAYNVTWPFARITVDETTIQIDVTFIFYSRSYTFASASVTRLSEVTGIFSRGLRIEHTVKDYPPFVLFWSFGLRKLRKALEDRGHKVIRSKFLYFHKTNVS
jgi:hypothetical protein